MTPFLTLDTLLSPMELAILEQCRQEGRQEGQQAGMLQALRQAVVEALEARFGAVPHTAGAKVRDLSAETDLRRALRLAVTTPSVEQFFKDL